MGGLSSVHPQSVFRFFEDLCQIPHGSGNTKAISDYCVAFAKARNLQWYQDSAHNVIVYKPASSGYEAAPTLILQGHLDMVCAKEPGVALDFEKDGLRLQWEGDWIRAQGTSLGADDGIAVAMMLAILDDKKLAHPALEAVFTTDEETGMDGARALDLSKLHGRYLINLDSEEEGILTVSCAGGARVDCHLPVRQQKVEGVRLDLTVSGLTGGHSGVQIDKGLANANVLMGRLLYGLARNLPIRIAGLEGGEKDNAICREAQAAVIVAQEDKDRAMTLISTMTDQFRREHATTDPDLKVQATAGWVVAQAVCPQDAKAIAALLHMLPNGIQSMSREIDGLVQTSLNMGLIRLEEEEMRVSYSVRSSLTSEKEMVIWKLEAALGQMGGTVTVSGDYPAWEYRKDSSLLQLVSRLFAEQYGREPVVAAIHAGLECGVFAGGLENLQCISLGPEIRDVHTTRETLVVSSVVRTWQLVLGILEKSRELEENGGKEKPDSFGGTRGACEESAHTSR